MPENTVSTSELASQYIAQVSSDLESNVKEQDRLREEISALEAQLAALQRDHAVLVNVQQALGTAAAPARPTAGADSVAVPSPRKPAAKSKAAKQARARKSPAAPSRTTAKKAAAGSPQAKDTAAKAAAKPTLVELVRSHLAEQNEPRSAAEVTSALGKSHPERGIKTTVVRTALEGLVARNLAQRTKQGSSVFYTSPDAPGQSARGEEKQPSPAE